MKIPFITLELCYSVCQHDYSESENAMFDAKLLELSKMSKKGIVEFGDFSELYFEGMTAKDQELLKKEVKKNIM